MSLLAAADLDRTLIYSRAAFGLAREGREPDTVCVEVLDGAPLSYVTTVAHGLLIDLAESGALVPVTSRTVAQYRRVKLPGRTPLFAICANGGRLLVNGVEDLAYRSDLEIELADAGAPLEQVWQLLQSAANDRARIGNPLKSIRCADDLFCYAVEHVEASTDWVDEIAARAAPLGWGVTRQLRKVYLVPDALTKLRALREVIERTGATYVLAAGDAHLDVPILEHADAAIRPAHGELHDQRWTAPRLSITTASGVLAGEEIARWMLGHLREVDRRPTAR